MRPIAGTITDPAATRSLDAMPDIIVSREGDAWLLSGGTTRGRDYLRDHVYDEYTEVSFGGKTLVVEGEYFVDIHDAAVDAGLRVR
jgi:hypothetical protein